MSNQFTAPITYFLEEGRANLRECLRTAFRAACNHNIRKIVIFTAQGLGVTIALDEFSSRPENAGIRLIAVTFPVGQPFKDAEGKPVEYEISTDLKRRFHENAIPVVRAHMPFDPISSQHRDRGVLGHDLSLVESALNAFGGSMSLCIQAVMIACDAGEVEWGEHVIALTSDTAILAQAAPTRRMLTDLAVREILCKPAIYNIGRGEKAEDKISQPPEMLAPGNKAIEGQIIPSTKEQDKKA
ncbi:MAG TPA: hypothetical protein VNZ03_20710 [Terriglobales bacterium]|jgi:hypothetical protein|nr:hypothetical protein [Terriglobales bacterium]